MINLELLNENESIDLELQENTGGGVTDVLVNGESIVMDGVAKIPIAKGGVPGLMCVDPYSNQGGLYRANGQTGLIRIQRATPSVIDERKSNYEPIVPSNLDYAVKVALSDEKGQAWTSEEKANARERIGVEWTLLGDMTVEEDGVTKIEIPIDDPNYNEFQVYVYANRVSNPSSNTLVINFNKLTTNSYALITNGVGTKTEVYLRGIIQRHVNNGWISWCVSSHDRQVLTGITGRGGQYSEAWKTDNPTSINVSLATGLDIGSKFVVYAR